MPLALVLQRHPVYGANSKFERASSIIRARSAAMGYLARVYIQDDELPPERLMRILRATGVEAVLLGPLFDSALLDAFEWERFSVVAWEPGYILPPFHIFLSNVAQSIIRGVEICRERGYRRAGVVLYREQVPPVDNFERRGALDYCARELQTPTFRFGAVEIDDASQSAFDRWFDRFRPDAVIGQTDLIYFRLRNHGIEPGKDCGFLSLHIQFSVPNADIAGFNDDRSRTALAALRLLDSEVRNFERGIPDLPQRILLTMPWHEGRTLPPRSGR